LAIIVHSYIYILNGCFMDEGLDKDVMLRGDVVDLEILEHK
jgi:hypothetical protein